VGSAASSSAKPSYQAPLSSSPWLISFDTASRVLVDSWLQAVVQITSTTLAQLELTMILVRLFRGLENTYMGRSKVTPGVVQGNGIVVSSFIAEHVLLRCEEIWFRYFSDVLGPIPASARVF